MKGLFYIFTGIWSMFAGCPVDKHSCENCEEYKWKLNKAGRFEPELKESSGLVYTHSLLYSVSDSGNPAELHEFSLPAQRKKISYNPISLEVDNVDFESLAIDNNQNIIVGDIGNNQKNRDTLFFYHFNSDAFPSNLYQQMWSYPDQSYDSEAIISLDNDIILFTKNIVNDSISIYRINAKTKQHQTAEKLSSLYMKNTFVTGADYNFNTNTLALLAYGKIILYDDLFAIDEDGNYRLREFKETYCRKVIRTGQAEAITFINDSTLLITNEKGKVFTLSREKKNRR